MPIDRTRFNAVPEWGNDMSTVSESRDCDVPVLLGSAQVLRVLDRTLVGELPFRVASSSDRLLQRIAPTHDSLPREAVLLEVPGTLGYRGLVTRTVAAACRVASGESPENPDEYVNEVVSAVGEAFNNVVLHGYADDHHGSICVVVEGREDGVAIELRDFGVSFDPNSVDLPDTLEPSESGMGLFILHSFVDRVEYTAGNPNTLWLFKRFPWNA